MTPEERSAVEQTLRGVADPVIVELGAYRGEDGPNFEAMVDDRMRLTHVMVEPDEDNWRFILANSPLSKRRRLWPCAIAAEDGWRRFHRSHDKRDGSTGSGSILEPTGHLEHFPTIHFEEDRRGVQCITLDHLFDEEKLSKIDLLWVDIQGAEREMIAGGKRALAVTRFLFMEAESIQMYNGQATKPELLDMLLGWELIGDFDFNVLLRNCAL